jgi:hypothetical protein
MAGIYRAYGQIRRGAGPWRSPFLVPVADIQVAPWPSSHVSIDTGGTAPDLVLGLKVLSLDKFPKIAVQLEMKPFAFKVLTDITVRVVLLMDAESQLLDSGPIEPSAQFAVLQHHTDVGETFPGLFQVTVNVGNFNIDSDATAVTSPGIATPFPPGKITVNRVSLDVRDYRGGAGGPGAPLHIGGGLVTAPMVSLTGVETGYNPITTQYSEAAHSIRGIDLAWMDGPGPLPTSGTALDARLTGSPSSPSRFKVDIDTPVTQDAPEGAPTLARLAGGGLRDGHYRYCSTWVHQNGCESGPSSRSDPVTISGTERTVRVSGLPAAPAAPSPDPTGLAVTARRLYRTDPDASSAATAADRGTAGDDVLVAELPVATTTFDDAGPSDPASIPELRTDYLSLRYEAPVSLDVSGTIRLVDGEAGSDESYGGTLTDAPTALRVVHKPGRDPRLLLVADGPAGALTVSMPGMATDFGSGLSASVTGLPATFAMDWSILGSEFFGLAAAGDLRTVIPGGADPAVPIGQVGVVLGAPSRPASWPAGEADVAVELRDATAGTPNSLFAMTGLRRGAVRSGARRWSVRDAEAGVVEFSADFEAGEEGEDRTIRFARTAADPDPFVSLAVDGHFLPDHVHGRARFPAVGDPSVLLDTRVRFLRAAFEVLTGAPGADDGALDGVAFLDDTTDVLEASLGATPRIATRWPVRVAGTVRTRPRAAAPPDMTIWPDVIVPPKVAFTPPWPLTADLGDVGVSGRVAVGWGDEAPLGVRATPQVKVLSNGSAETPPGLRALSARVLALSGVAIPESVLLFGEAGKDSGVVDVEPVVDFGPRANSALRVEAIEREGRVASEPDLRAPAGTRSWVRARTVHLPTRLTPSLRLVAGSPIGADLVTSEPWGEGVAWAEPSFVWEPPETAAPGAAGDLSADQGIGLVTVGWDGIPARVEAWLMDGKVLAAHPTALDGKVPVADRLPDIGPATSSWVPGGVVLRLDGPMRLSGLHVALWTGASRVCWNDTATGGFGVGVILEPDHPVRHGNWIEAIAPFVELVPASAGLRDVVLWFAKEFEPPPGPTEPGSEPNPCAAGDEPDGPDQGIGWRIHDEMRLKLALKYFDLVTPSGVLSTAPRWWAMPTASERWNGDDVDAGEWQLRYELQMDDYGMAKVAVYPGEGLSNPFGDWQGGNGTFWARARSVEVAGPFSLDVYLGNVGGGTGIPFSNALYSTLPRIFNWSYP